MRIWNNQSLSEALGVVVGSGFIEGGIIHFNSQDVSPGDIFIALEGASGNGHDYAVDALRRGAACVIVDRRIDGVPEDMMALVGNTMDALHAMAHFKRARSDATFIAVTGSAGKTSIKEWLLDTLSIFGRSFASRGSYNNMLGITLDLASMGDDVEYAIFEVGMNHSGEIREMMPYILPDIALINNILPAHIGNFASLDDIADAKLEIIEGAQKDRFVLILNRDNSHYNYCVNKARAYGVENILSFGDSVFDNDADANLVNYNFDNMMGHHVINILGQEVEFSSVIGGRHRILNLVAILLICEVLDLDIERVADHFGTLVEPKGRGKISSVVYNGNQCVIIDDAYNANPIAMIASLRHFKTLSSDYKIAILGDMRELGIDEITYHMDLLPHILDAKIDKIYTVGHLMYELYKILPSNIKGEHFIDYIDLENNLDHIINRDVMILFKASKSVKLWHSVDMLTHTGG